MAVATNKLASRLAMRSFADGSVTATDARKIGWVPMREYFLAIAMLTVNGGSGGLAAGGFKVFAATSSAGANATEVKAHGAPTGVDAVGKQLILEVSAEEVQNAKPGATHVSVEVKNAHANDRMAVTYVGSGIHEQDGLTADIIA